MRINKNYKDYLDKIVHAADEYCKCSRVRRSELQTTVFSPSQAVKAIVHRGRWAAGAWVKADTAQCSAQAFAFSRHLDQASQGTFNKLESAFHLPTIC